MHVKKIALESYDRSRLVLAVAISICLVACNTNRFKYRVVSIDGITLKGKMTKDTVLDGEIKYYRDTTLIAVRHFNQGIEEGQFVNYSRTNKVEQSGYAKNGLTEGLVSVYDEKGYLIRKENYYRGRLMGSQIKYDSNKLKSYTFLNFENNALCTFSYFDGYTTLDQGAPAFNVFSELTINGVDKIKLFCYIFQPPKFRCEYTVGTILGDNAETFSEIQKISSNDLFYENDFPALQDSNSHYCVKANVYDSTSRHSRLYYGIY